MPAEAHDEQYLGLPLGRFLDLLAGPEPAPSGGGAAALAVSLAASLCAMTARLSARHLGTAECRALATEAERIAAKAASLIQADADSYQRVLKARRRLGDRDTEQGRADVAAALSAASEVPMQIAELAVPAARAAAHLAAAGNPALRGDAITGAVLAEAGARAAAALVRINLAGAPDDSRPARAAGLADEAASLAAGTQR
jgi:methenyltetrahydrofolate cyclohydrolase